MSVSVKPAAKRPVNVTISADLVTRARGEGLNLSALAEEAVAAALDRIARDPACTPVPAHPVECHRPNVSSALGSEHQDP